MSLIVGGRTMKSTEVMAVVVDLGEGVDFVVGIQYLAECQHVSIIVQ